MKTNDLLRYGALTGLFLTPILPFIVSGSMLFPFITGKAFAFRIIIEITFVLWAILALRDQRYRPKKSVFLILITLFVVVLGIADLFGQYPYKSFWSNYERMEGYVTIIHLFLFFLVSSSILNSESLWRKYFGTWLSAGVLMGLYAILQLAGKITINQGGVRVDGTFGNATYLAVFLLFMIFISTFLFLRSRAYNVWLFAPVTLLFTVILYYTATRGAILGLIGGIILSGVLIAYKEKENRTVRKFAFGTLLIFVLLVGGFFALRNTDFVTESPVLSRFANLSVSEIRTQGRYYVWPMAIEGFKERPILGWGQENFNYVFNEKYDPRMYNQEQWFDRSHNNILDWLIAGGIPTLALYLSLFVASVFLVWRKSEFKPSEKGVLTGLLAAYFFQNLFVFDNLVSYILFFSILAYIHFSTSKEVIKLPSWFTTRNAINVSASLLVILCLFSIYFINMKPIFASQSLIDALSQLRQGGPSSAVLEEFKDSFSFDTFGNPEILEQLANAAGAFLSNSTPEELREEYVDFTRDKFEVQVAKTPEDARYHLFHGLFLSRLGQYDLALESLERARALSPKKQAILFEIGIVHMSRGNFEEANEVLKEAYELEPSFERARILYGLSALNVGEEALADELFAGISPEVLYSDNALLNYYFQKKDYQNMIKIFGERIKMNPDNPQNHISLAVAYLEAGQRAKSIETLESFVEKYPQYETQLRFYINEIKAGRNPIGQ